MRYKLPDGRAIQHEAPFEMQTIITIPAQGDIDPQTGEFVEMIPAYEELQTVQFPNGVRGLSDEQIAEYGITPVVENPRPDDRFYIVTETEPGEYDPIPRDVEPLIAAEIASIKIVAASLLAQTDWMINRALETGTSIDDAIRDYRSAVRAYSNELETTISDFDFHEFKEWKTNEQPIWPVLS